MPIQNQQQAEALAEEILALCRGSLLTQLRFLAPAICNLPLQADAALSLGTDGGAIYYEVFHVLRLYRLKPELVTRGLLHQILHCVFHHPFVGQLVDSDAWDLACDAAVEAVIDELALPGCETARIPELDSLLARLRQTLPQLSAERIYRHLVSEPGADWRSLRQRFAPDSHELWYRPGSDSQQEDAEPDDGDGGDGESGQQNGTGGDQEPEESDQPGASGDREQPGDDRTGQQAQELEAQWARISQQVQTELETVSRTRGDQAAALLQNLRACNRPRQDYSAFLRRFAVLGEQLKLNPDEFDYVYYTYGLQHYGNLPLLEPLEYQESFRIRDFVVALDTSASVSGDTVQRFVQKTYELLCQSASFFDRIRLHLIQCDARVQHDRLITSREELAQALDGLQLHGGGGTDFRPVFDHVDELIASRALTNLRGLIYFTDADGTFPARPPAYQTVFVLPDDLEPHPVPPWAMQVLLEPEL